MKPKPLVFFFPLSYLLSWYPWLLKAAGVPTSSGLNPLGFLQMVFHASLNTAALP